MTFRDIIASVYTNYIFIPELIHLADSISFIQYSILRSPIRKLFRTGIDQHKILKVEDFGSELMDNMTNKTVEKK